MKNDISCVPKFEFGTISDSPGASESLRPEDVIVALGRHVIGDWDETDPSGRELNWVALSTRTGRVISHHRSATGVRFVVFTDLVGHATVIVLADEAPDHFTRWD